MWIITVCNRSATQGSRRDRAAAQVLEGNPGVSLQQVATVAGISPGTVRDVRDRLARGQNPVLAGRARRQTAPTSVTGARPRAPRGRARQSCTPGASGTTAAPRTGERAGNGRNASVCDADGVVVLQRLKCDPALRFSESGRAILRQLHAATAVIGQLGETLANVPPHSAIAIGKLARANARIWMELARQLEERA
jgi:hypothetical protein